MRIKELLNKHRNDFVADMVCEHCGRVARLSSGYDDANYHRNVIPNMRCKGCGKNQAGETEHTDKRVSSCSVQ